jgi:UDP-N-acetylglucosamine diphosphorylase / glucose-1-phosphate thymidylyltransferase / UDP-N-acetylgalactosamine diphosphorylase / glucosamine-1-phosphate N-acetyltransferase / galactosamine-1-phosphate N-acetyltransferase
VTALDFWAANLKIRFSSGAFPLSIDPMSQTFAPADFFDLEQTEHHTVFDHVEFVWDALPKIAPYLQFRLRPEILGKIVGRPFLSNQIYLGKGSVVEQGAFVKGPAWIGENCQIRSGAYIRENVIIGNGCVIGNSSELKNSIIFNNAEIPHFNYVGDSILGHKAHIGAGVICSNVRLDRSEISVRSGTDVFPTGLRKFGAIIGDRTEVGCNSVLSPGSILGRDCLVYPGVQWRGILPSGHIAKLRQELAILPNRKSK